MLALNMLSLPLPAWHHMHTLTGEGPWEDTLLWNVGGLPGKALVHFVCLSFSVMPCIAGKQKLTLHSKLLDLMKLETDHTATRLLK